MKKKHGYGYSTDRAIDALVKTSRSLVGDTKQARDLIMALCDQAGASLETQRAITALIEPPALCVNCGLSSHARCCSWCGEVHKPARLQYEHCSAKCARASANADRISAAMEETS